VIATACRWSRTCGGAIALVTLALLATLAPLPAGPAAGSGTHLNPAAAPASAGVTIGTVPAVAGFPVTLDGVTQLTDGAGTVRFHAAARSDRRLSERLTLTEAILPIGGRDVKVSASKLYPSTPVRMLALDLSYLVHFGFSSGSGSPIDASSIATITVKSPFSEVAQLPAHDGAWLQGSRVVNTGAGLAVEPLEWTVQRVEYAGSNVVNTSQQRFRPAEQQTVDVKLLFFSMRLQVRDAFFDHPQGGAVELVYPDGRARRFAVDDSGRLQIPALPRGHYTLTILGPGPEMPRPLAISRDQDLDLSFYSWWDVGSLVGALAALAVSLAAVGVIRRRRFSGARRTKHGDDDDAAGAATATETSPADAPPAEESPSTLAVLDRRMP
jgi:hypothetical protein